MSLAKTSVALQHLRVDDLDYQLHESVSTLRVLIVTSWNSLRHVGVIALLNDRSQRFFMFGTRVLSGPDPKLGSVVTFERSTLAPEPNRLPLADHIHVSNEVSR